MLDRISKADRISLAGAIVLFIGLFLPWYKPDVGDWGEGLPAASSSALPTA